ncbi:MAG TPA: hypothetical protein H9891_07995 [Candidatus Salinicoccus stercoripullorum]|uniref:Uncharacterized protein n=1 Tax=Candidatus Salinicoccus stercoripullorum TaxID=2838756 RepID=A0A9D1U046_9STAP|nr:hypothetical protein [Candidatus Salinicoccus stercoripullorum]
MVMLFIFLWGFSEATWFFIIPDVILSLYTLSASLHLKWKILLWSAVWVIVYLIYFSVHPF